MSKKQLSNSALATIVVAALAVSIAGITLAANYSPLTGYQTSNPNGTVQFTLQQVASLRFAVDTVNFGTGFVNTSGGNTACVLDTMGTNDVNKCRNFTTQTMGLVLENDGTINLTVTLLSNTSAAQFIGGTGPVFAWKTSNNGSETGSCGNLTPGPNASFVDVNTTSPGTLICQVFSGGIGGFNFLDNNDTMRIDINITIPYDALAGTKRATLTATGTPV